MAQTRLARGRAAAITAATAAGAITTAISTTATTTTIIPTTTKKGKTICAPPPPLTTTATTAAAAPINRPRRNSRRLASTPAKPAAPSVPVNLASEDSEYEKEESRNKTPVPTTSEVHEIFPYLRKMFLDPESGAGVEARLLQWEMFSQAAGRQKLLRAAENKKRGKKRSYPSPTPKYKPYESMGTKLGTATGTVYMRRESPPTASLPNSLRRC
ncbi:hypothetical protein TWF594_008490 [Orbilia oligospora]|nr:hypothetical protein TWF594_008490 [Orbilia oligospora]